MRRSLLAIMSILALVATASPATAASASGSRSCPSAYTPWVEAKASGSVYHTAPAPGVGNTVYKYTTPKATYRTMRTYGTYNSGGGNWRVDAYEGYISSHSTGCNAGQP